MYAYDVDEDGGAVTTINYTYKKLDDGTQIEYFKGSIVKITKPDGSTIDNVEFDPVTRKLSKFSLHTADGKHRNVSIQDDLVIFEMEDSTRLVFYEDKLVALGNSQGIVPIYDLDKLSDIVYVRDPGDAPDVPIEEIDIAASNWRHQTYEDSLGIRFVERDYADDQWELSVDLEAGDANYSEGEMFLDLRYDIPGLAWQAPIDMTGKEISFLVKLDDSFEYDPLYPPEIQVFAKDSSWNTQYGTEVVVDSTSSWITISLRPTEENINLGYTDPGFDPTKIVMLGIRITPQGYAPEGLKYLGKVMVKENILPDLFENVNCEGSPLDDLYYGLGVGRNLDLLTGGEPLDEEGILENFVDSLGSGPSGLYQQNLLNQISWHIEDENEALKAIKSVYRDTATDEFVLTMDLETDSATNSKGEIYFDLRKDVPGLGWDDPLNMTSRPLSMLIEVPEEMIGSVECPNGARLFVEDASGNIQYGTWVNLKEGEKLYQMDLTPTFGDIPMGYTFPGFDPSRIVRVGINISTQSGSNTDFHGQVRVKFLPINGDGVMEDIVDMPLWMDLRGIKEYLVDDDDNYLRVPGVQYLPETYYSYVFNDGSGIVPTAYLDSVSHANTVWKRQGGGIASISWNADGDMLEADLNMVNGYSMGELYLDPRYSCYVPDKNWYDGRTVDMTSTQLEFYVRTSEDFQANTSVPLIVEAFAKDSVWKTEYSQVVTLEPDGEWMRVQLTPSPVDFNSGYAEAGFNPTKISMFGLKIRSSSSLYTYEGKIEIRFSLNELDQGLTNLGDTGELPPDPVWVDQRDLVEYIKGNDIALYGDYSIMAEVNGLIEEIPDLQLPGDFAAYFVYDDNDKVTSISKPDGTTSWFDDDGKIDLITFDNGDIFIDYDYDESGDLVDATLVSAREKLKKSMSDISCEIERRTADTLLLLAEQKSLLTEDFMREVNAQRAVFSSEISRLYDMKYQRIKHKTWYGEVYYEEIEVPGVQDAINQIRSYAADFDRQVSEQLALLDGDIQAKKEEIEAEKELVLGEYAFQERKMLNSIVKEETIPLVYYYYRTVIGREATQDEIEALSSMRYDSKGYYDSFTLDMNDITDANAMICSLASDTASPLYTGLSEEARTIVDAHAAGGSVTDEELLTVVSAINAVILDSGLYDALLGYYGTKSALESGLSADTITYISGLTCLDRLGGRLGYLESKDVNWLNRYVVHDLVAGIAEGTRASSPWDNVNFVGVYAEEMNDADALIAALTLDKDSPVYVNLPSDSADIVDSYVPGAELSSEDAETIAHGLDAVMLAYDLYGQMVAYYGSESAFRSKLSSDTIAYADGLSCLACPVSGLMEKDKVDIAWLNRYILQDILPGLRPKEKYARVFSAEALKEDLVNSSEAVVAAAFKANVTSGVITFITEYLNDPGQRAGMLAGLGLTGSDVINITDAFIRAVQEWLEGQDVHFGRSAFGTLARYLEENGVNEDLETVAVKSLLIDLLMGITGPATDEKIEISMYTMNKVATLFGVSGTTCRLTYQDILAIEGPFITLINKSHYVTVLDVTASEVTYWDSNLGTDGGEVTISRSDFESNWQGDVIANTPIAPEKVLTDVEAQNIKGAFFWLIIPIITGIIEAVTAVVTVVMGAITGILSTLATVVGNVMAGLVQAVANIGNMLVFVGKTFLGAMGIGGGAGAGAAAGTAAAGTVATGFSVPTLISGAGTTLIKIGVGYGVSVGLEALGVDPVLSGLIASVVTGGVSGFMGENAGIQMAFKTALQYGAASGMTLLGQHFDLDPMLTNILSMTTSVLTGASLDPEVTVGQALEKIAPDITRELAYYGVTYAGEAMGIDPRISNIAGIMIRSSLQAGLGTFGSGGGSPGAWLDGALQGLLQGATSIGLNYIVDELDIDPLLANIGFSAIATTINGTLRSMFPDNENLDIFKFIFDTYEENALTFLGVEDPQKPFSLWQRAAYISQIQDFTRIIKDRGIVEALNVYATSFFSSIAVNSIVSTGYTLGEYFKEKLNAGDYTIKVKDGKQYAEVAIEDSEGNKAGDAYFGWLEDTQGWDDFMGISELDENGVNADKWGDLYADMYGNIGYYGYSELYSQYGDLGIFQTIKDGYQQYVEVRDNDGTVLFVVEPREEGGYNYYNSYGDYVDAKIKGFDEYEMHFYDGLTDELNVPQYFDIPDDVLEVFSQYGIREEDVRNTKFGVRRNAKGEYEEFLEPRISWSAESSTVFGDAITAEYLVSDTFKTKTEIVKNYYKGYGVVTDAELRASVQNEYKITIDKAQEGDRIFFSGETPIDMAIKAFEFGKGNSGVIMNHEGVITVINGKKYVYEVQPEGISEVLGGNALKLVPLEKVLARYVTVDAQGNVTKVNGIFKVVRPNDVVKSQAAVDEIRNVYFEGYSNDDIANCPCDMPIYASLSVSVNYKALVGNFNNNNTNSMICSELYNRAYFDANGSIPDGVNRDYDKDWGQRISPQDDFNAREEYGRELSTIVAGGGE
ncbi:MAG: cysteine peptidase family C39 domain-containing protein [Candidatus Omnitrophica bacterium]|nr:cysteine peptidase family C39 domain-containing protein [Candidatus Omnitrophota bacterium]